MFLALILYFSFAISSEETKSVSNSSLIEKENLFRSMSEEEFHKAVQMNKKLRDFTVKYISLEKVRDFLSYAVEKNFNDHEQFDQQQVLIDIWQYPILNFKKHRICFCKCEKLSKFLPEKFVEIFEILCESETIQEMLELGTLTIYEDINKLFVIFLSFVYKEAQEDGFEKKFSNLLRSIHLEILNMMIAEVEFSKLDIKEVVLTVFYSFLSDLSSLPQCIEYIDEVANPNLKVSFTFSRLNISLKYGFAKLGLFSPSQVAPQIIIKHLNNYEKLHKLLFKEQHDFNGTFYSIASFTFEQKSSSKKTIFRYFKPTQKFIDCDENVLNYRTLSEMRQNSKTIHICFEKLNCPEQDGSLSSITSRLFSFVHLV